MGAGQGRQRDAHDVIVDPLYALVLQGVDGGRIINRSHDQGGREPSHMLFPQVWTLKNSIREQDGFCHLYGVKRLGGRLVQAFVSRPAHPSPSIVVVSFRSVGFRYDTSRRDRSQHPILEEADLQPTC